LRGCRVDAFRAGAFLVVVLDAALAVVAFLAVPALLVEVVEVVFFAAAVRLRGAAF
jgi:hypothetical protein